MQAGTMVICVDDSNWDHRAKKYFNKLPVKDGLYRVRRIIPNIIEANGPEGLALEGIYGDWVNFKSYTGKKVFEEYHFRKNRFAELQPHEDLEEIMEELSSFLETLS
jgi:hypothetical protein